MGQSFCASGRGEEENTIDVKGIFDKQDRYVHKKRKSPLLKRRIRHCEKKLERAKQTYKDFKDEQALNSVFANSCTSERTRWGKKAVALHRR